MYPWQIFSSQKIRLAGLAICMCACLMQHSYAQNVTARLIDLPRPLRRNVLNLNKDDDGFLWLRNSQGLWRYDGTNAQLFDITKFKLTGNELVQLFTCFDHFLVLIDHKGNLRVYDQLNDTAYKFPLGNSMVYNFIHAQNNALLFFNADGQGYTFTRKNMLQKGPDITQLRGWKKGMHVFASAVDGATGRLFLYLGPVIAYMQGDSLVTADTYNGKQVDKAYRFATNTGFDVTSKYLVINNPHGFLIFDKNTLKLLNVYNGTDIAGRMVIDDQLVFLAKKNITEFNDSIHSPLFILEPPLFSGGFTMYDIVPSGYEGRFLAVGDMGLCELTFNKQKNDSFYNAGILQQAFANKSIRGIKRVNNNLYVGTYSGFYGYNGKTVTKISPQLVYSMVQYDAQTLLLGIENANGLAVYNTVTQKTELPFEGTRMNAIRCLYAYQGQHWGGADNSLYQFYKQNGRWYKNKWFTDTSLGAVRQIAANNNNWYMATQNGFFVLNNNRQLTKLYPQNKNLIIYAFVPAGNGFMLATQANGIVYIDDKGNVQASYGVNEGLPGNYVYSLVKAGNLLVAGTSAGTSVFLMQGTGLKAVPLGEDDNAGLFDQECNHGAFFNDTIGQQVILGGLQGLMFVDKNYYTLHANDKPGKVELSYVKLVGNISKPGYLNMFAYCAPVVTIPPNEAYISLKFSSPLNFNHSQALMRIRGISDNWQSFNLTDEVNLINLPPGKYTLEARLGESLSQQYWFSKTLVILPAFYQTLWFRLLIWAAALLFTAYIIYLFWRSKVRKLRAEQQLRTTIASDLHDDIGSTLNSISVYTEIAGHHLNSDAAKAKILLDKMGMASRSMIDTMSDIVWTINPKNDDFENVLKRVQFFAGELLSGKNILLQFELDDRVKKLKLTMQERKNIYLICKEAINNIYKYSGATVVTVKFAKDNIYLALTIADNGQGFNINAKSSSGNGLTNIKSRAAEIGGEVTITSEAQKGTQLFLRLKIA